jgi:hypothetical protein
MKLTVKEKHKATKITAVRYQKASKKQKGIILEYPNKVNIEHSSMIVFIKAFITSFMFSLFSLYAYFFYKIKG